MPDPIPANQTAPKPASNEGEARKQPDPTPLLVNGKAAAEILSLGERTVWSLTACNAIPHHHVGRSVRYSIDELKLWISKGCPTEPGAADVIRAAAAGGAA